MALPLVLAAALPEVCLAISLLLLLYAANTFFAKPLTAILSQIPVVGGAAAGAVAKGIGWVIGMADDWARWSVGAMVELIHVPVQGVVNAITAIVSTVEAVAAYLPHLVAALQAGIAAARALAANAASVAVSATTGALVALARIASLSATVAGIIAGTIPHAIAAAVAVAEAFTRSALGSLQATLTTLVHAGDAALRALIAGEAAALAAAKGDLLHLIAAQGAVLTNAVAQGIAGLRHDVDIQVGSLEREIGDLRTIVQPIAAAGVVTAIAAIEAEVTMLRRTCIDPTCSVITPQLGVLNALLDGAMLLAVLGAAGEAIRDPEGAARATAGVVDHVHSLVSDIVSGPLGVQV